MSSIRLLPRFFFQGAIRMFQRDNEMRNIVLTDAEARDKATRHFFNRALREARDNPARQ
jgi:type I restriction enzyme R subunit